MSFTSLPIEIKEDSALLEYKSGFKVFLETPVPTEQFSDFSTAFTEVWTSVMTECKLLLSLLGNMYC